VAESDRAEPQKVIAARRAHTARLYVHAGKKRTSAYAIFPTDPRA
jgi:hypothetical protein